jgi:hypothetical protein
MLNEYHAKREQNKWIFLSFLFSFSAYFVFLVGFAINVTESNSQKLSSLNFKAFPPKLFFSIFQQVSKKSPLDVPDELRHLGIRIQFLTEMRRKINKTSINAKVL